MVMGLSFSASILPTVWDINHPSLGCFHLPTFARPSRGRKHPRQPFRPRRRKARVPLGSKGGWEKVNFLDFFLLRTKEATFFDGFGCKFLPWFDLKSETSKVSWRLEPVKWFKREFNFCGKKLEVVKITQDSQSRDIFGWRKAWWVLPNLRQIVGGSL